MPNVDLMTSPYRTPVQNSAAKASAATVISAAAADALLILVFAALGREAHQRGDIITGVLLTAWPFLAGAAIMWLLMLAWKAPFSPWPAGVGVWLGTVAIGMLLRALTNQTVVVTFIIVALVTLGVFLLGHRFVVTALMRRRASRRKQMH
jgi:drug/metabolite transporter (DMT)-like permease